MKIVVYREIVNRYLAYYKVNFPRGKLYGCFYHAYWYEISIELRRIDNGWLVYKNYITYIIFPGDSLFIIMKTDKQIWLLTNQNFVWK